MQIWFIKQDNRFYLFIHKDKKGNDTYAYIKYASSITLGNSMNIKLFCAGGVTAGTLTEAVKKICGPEDEVSAYDINQLDTELPGTDVVLIAPQIRYRYKVIKAKCDEANVPSGVIDPIAVGRLDGKRVLDQAKAVYAEAHK